MRTGQVCGAADVSDETMHIFLENFGRNLEKVLAIFTRIGYAKSKETASFKSPQSFSRAGFKEEAL